MPEPRSGESESNFVGRCIPQVLDEGVTDPSGDHREVDSREEAAAICYSMFEQKGVTPPLTPDQKAGWITVDDQPVFISGPSQGSGSGGSYQYAQNREEWVEKAESNAPAPENLYRWVNLKELHDLTSTRPRHYSMDVTEDPDWYFPADSDLPSESFVNTTYGRVILDGPTLHAAGWKRDPHLFGEMAWRKTGPASDEAIKTAFQNAIKRVEILHNPSGEPLDFLQNWLDFRMDRHVPVVPHEDYSEWNKSAPSGLHILHTEQNIPLGAEITLQLQKVQGDDGWVTELELLSAPTLKTCAAQNCTNPPTWELTVSDRHLHYCNDHLEGAVKLLERHELVLEDIKSLKGASPPLTPEGTKAQTGVILALKPDPDLAQELALEDQSGSVEEALAPDDLHVTLCYLGTIDALSQEFKQERLMRAMEGLADRIAPFQAKLNGITRFTETHNGLHAIVLNVDSPALPEIRQKLTETLHNIGYDLDDTHGFTPHLTLAYVDEAASTPSLSLPDFETTFSDLYVFWGNDHQRFPLNTEIYEENEHGLKGQSPLKSPTEDWKTVKEIKATDEHFDKIAQELTEAEGVKVSAEAIKEVILLPWQRSTAGTPASLHLQALSARTFGHSVTYHLKEKIEAVDIKWDFLYPMGAIYNRTQDYLKEEGYSETDTIELYHPFFPTSGPAKQWSKGDEVRIATNPLTSWTTDIQEAAAFARFLASPGSPTFVLKSYLPIKSVISAPAAGFGMPDTGEVIPAGGEYMAIVELEFRG